MGKILPRYLDNKEKYYSVNIREMMAPLREDAKIKELDKKIQDISEALRKEDYSDAYKKTMRITNGLDPYEREEVMSAIMSDESAYMLYEKLLKNNDFGNALILRRLFSK